jgi:pimeloyl-ACP methyl ester carboxylesterase
VAEISHRKVQTNGITLRIAEAGEGPLVLMVHGFPESWYSWRHQIPALTEAGYHAVAVDVRGYGESDRPEPIEAYSMKTITADMAGVLDALGAETAVVAGHDWGSPIAWHCALLYPERFRAVIAMSVPYIPRAPAPPLQILKQVMGERFFYILYFQEPGVAEAELEADVRRSLATFMYFASGDVPPEDLAPQGEKKKGEKFLDRMPEPQPVPWLSDEDLDYYTKEFERAGFRGGLNRYRNMDRDWEQLPELANAKVQQPALFIAGDRDGVVAFTSVEGMKANVPNLSKLVMLPGAGHWTQQERPAEVNAEMIEFLKGLES